MVLSEYAHLLPAYRPHAALNDSERIAWIRADRWLETAQARAALTRLEDLLSYPPRDRMPCLLLYGDTGMGKTKIIRKFLRDHPARFDSGTGVTTMPVVAMQMPAERWIGTSIANCSPRSARPGRQRIPPIARRRSAAISCAAWVRAC